MAFCPRSSRGRWPMLRRGPGSWSSRFTSWPPGRRAGDGDGADADTGGPRPDGFAIGTHPVAGMPAALDFMQGSHPYPDADSRAAGRAALARAIRRRRRASGPPRLGKASAVMAEAAEGLSFEDKLAATRAFMLAGADIPVERCASTSRR